MSEPLSLGLLPEGLRDVLPPQAEAEARLLRDLLDHLRAHGYERVGTPLIEFEASLTSGFGAARAADLFRLTDPISQRPLAVRSDITGQIARVAATRMAHFARPLRLSYAGPVLRIKGSQLRADRQFSQAGAELIGTDSAAAVAEVAGLAIKGLLDLGLEAVGVDFVLPDLIGRVGIALGMTQAEIAAAAEALDAKDIATVAALPHATVFSALLKAAGEVPSAKALLAATEGMPAIVGDRMGTLAELVAVLPVDPRLSLTVDPGETRGFGYQTWIGFSLFAKGIRGEVGRGGAYVIRRPDGSEEPAVGFSLYLDGLVEAGRGVEVRRRIMVPYGANSDVGTWLRAEGWATVAALEAGDIQAQAKDQRCTHYWDGKTIQPV
ncbi:ATP phosphoribosyltransferase regulatory subunit [Parapedomonas caeni]